MYANDLAYYDGTDEETYNRNSPELNVLQIAWRMELQNQVGNSHPLKCEYISNTITHDAVRCVSSLLNSR